MKFIWAIVLIVAISSCKKSRANNSLLGEINAENAMVIEMSSIGCFHSVVEIHKITKSSDNFYAQKKDQTTGLFGPKVHCKSGFENAYYYFEKNGLKLSGDGCTTVTSFKVSVGNKTIEFTDAKCAFNKYYDLKNEFN